jgi:starch phosphorylase
VGHENFFLFGLQAHEVADVRRNYDPDSIIRNDPDLAAAMQLLESGFFNVGEPGLFVPIVESIRNPFDQWLTAADFRSYVDAQSRVAEVFRNPEAWQRLSVLNTASSGHFSSDRTIRSYAQDIWGLPQP